MPTLATAVHPSATNPPAIQPDGVVIGLAPGAMSAEVRFSGTVAGEDDVVQVRLLDYESGTVVQDWTDLGMSSGGAFTGTIPCPKATGWWRAEVRARNNPGATTAFDTRFAVGWKIALWGQSQLAGAYGGAPGWYTIDPANEGSASWYEWHAWSLGGIPGNAVPESLTLITAANGRDGRAAFVDQFRVFDPATPLMLVREFVSGTGWIHMMNDADHTRQWSDLQDKIDRYGTDISVNVWQWGTSDYAGFGYDAEPMYDTLFGIADHGHRADHHLTDLGFRPPGYGFALSPLTHHGYAWPDGYRWSQIAGANARDLTVGPPVPDFVLDGQQSPHGTERASAVLGQRMAVAAARFLGLDDSANPSLSAASRSADGAKIVVSFDLPNGGSLNSGVATGLIGWEVSEDGGRTFVDTGFTANRAGDRVELVKDGAVWVPARFLQVRYRNDPAQATPYSLGAEQDRVDRLLYETWAKDVLAGHSGHVGGLPVGGRIVDGKWEYGEATMGGYTLLFNVGQS